MSRTSSKSPQKPSFTSRLSAIAKTMPPGVSRQAAERDARALVRAGVNFIPSLLSILENNNASIITAQHCVLVRGPLGSETARARPACPPFAAATSY